MRPSVSARRWILSDEQTVRFGSRNRSTRLDSFRRRVRERVLEPARNVDLFGTPPSGGIQAHELTRALAWFLQLRTSLGPYSTANYERFQDADVRVIENNSRWNVFDRWVVFLGLGWRINEGVFPDPTRAVLDLLDELLVPDTEMALPAFVSQLADRLPVVDGGVYQAAYLAATGGEPELASRHLSESLSLAFMRLQRRGILELYGGGDAEARVLRLGGDVDSSNQFVKRLSLTGELA